MHVPCEVPDTLAGAVEAGAGVVEAPTLMNTMKTYSSPRIRR